MNLSSSTSLALQKSLESFIFIHALGLGSHDSLLNPPEQSYAELTVHEETMEFKGGSDLSGTDVVRVLVQLSRALKGWWNLALEAFLMALKTIWLIFLSSFSLPSPLSSCLCWLP